MDDEGVIINCPTKTCCSVNNGGTACGKQTNILKCVESLEIRENIQTCNSENLVEFTETDGLTAIQRTKTGKRVQRVDTRESTQLDKSSLVSEIFVKYPKEDIDKEDALGGFISTISRSDGAYLHAFCSLEKDGIFAKDLYLKNKDILVSLNGIKILGSFTYDHAAVVELFRNLPMSRTISMVKYNRKTETFTTIEFLLEISAEELMVKEDSVKLMNSEPTVEVLLCPKSYKSLAYTNGQLSLCTSGDVFSNCAHHFVVKEFIFDQYLVYTFQVQKDKSKYLGLKEGRLDIIDRPNDGPKEIPIFRVEIRSNEMYLRPFGFDNKYVQYNKATGAFELGTRETITEGGGLRRFSTNCKP